MKEFKINCSSIGDIMADGRIKGSLGNTAQKYLKTWMLEQIFNRKKQVSSKYLDKGVIVEDESIYFAGLFLNDKLEKNKIRYESDFMKGIPDCISDNYIVEIKSSWDFTTFPYFDKNCPNSDYYWQCQGYMHLTGKNATKLIYVLSDTPLNIISHECKSFCFKTGYDFDEELPEFIKRLTYQDIMPSDKIKIFDITRNEDDINRIIERVELCREYINSIM